MKPWYQHITTCLEGETIDHQSLFDTPFVCAYLPAHRMCFHFISLSAKQLSALSPTFFTELNAQHPTIQMIHIWEDVYTRQPELVTARVRALIGKRKRIHGRATTAKRIDKKTAEYFLNQHHLQGFANAYYKFGLYQHQQLVAVATFSKSRVMYDEVVPYRSYELVRFASLTGHTVTGGLSKLLRAFIDEVRPAHIMTYADWDWGKGNGYQKLGFKFTGWVSSGAFYINPETMERFSEMQPHKLNLSESSFIRVCNSGSLKYTLSLVDYIS